MQKTALCGRWAHGSYRYVTKTLLVMKLTMILLTAAIVQVSAKGLSQTVSFNGKNAPLQEVLSAVKKQTGFFIIYNEVLLDKANPVTLNVTDFPLKEFLHQVFHNQPLDYSIKNKTIFISHKAAERESRNIDNVLAAPPTLVKGRILDADGKPLVGASVSIKKSKTSGVTDAEGVFSINANDGDIIQVSYIGYSGLSFKVNLSTSGGMTAVVVSSDQPSSSSETDEGSSSLVNTPGTGVSFTITLKRKESQLNEVVVNKGYYTESKRLSTGNVSTVKAADIEKQPINNPLLALEGRVPGLFITQSSGLAGSGVNVKIQGQNSLARGSDPLYVIDGVPYTSETLPTLNFILGYSGNSAGGAIPVGAGNPLSYINPADIESIDILKDADATAIYGSRAAAGAILITTKKGKVGKTQVNVNLQNGWGKVARKLNLLNTQQYLEMRHEALRNDNLTVSSTAYDINGVWDTTRNVDWQKELLGGTSKYKDAQLSVSGGNSNVQYLIGGGYHKETTVFPGDFSDQKGSMHFSINSISQNQKFKVQLTGNYLMDNNQLPTQDLTERALQLAPDAPMLYNPDGSLNFQLLPNGTSTFNNPLSFGAPSKYQNKTNNLIANSSVGYRILPGLEVKASFGFTRLQNDEIQTTPMAVVSPTYRPYFQRTTQFGHGAINSWILEPQATYSHKFGKGQFQVLAGATFQEQNSNLQQFTATGFNSDLVMEDIKSASSITPSATVISSYKYSALFGRLNYNWANKYIVNLTGRRDGSSRFGSENLFNNFWSVAGGWIFSEEKWIERSMPFISFGKLRASYGTTGNDQIGDYQFLNRYNTISNVSVPYQGVTSIAPEGIPNPYLQWEETKKFQFGVDLGLFKDRILLNANYVQNRSSNQLLSYSLPISTGVGSIITNFPATIENTAWELSVSTNNIHAGNFKWTSNFNLTVPKNKLVAFPNIEASSYSWLLVVGQPFTISKFYHFRSVDPATGAYVFNDSKGVLTSEPQFPTDATVVLNASPRFYGGLQNTISYKGFELSFLFQFTKQIGANYAFGFLPGRFNLNQPDYVLSRWQKPGDVTNIQRYSSNFDLFDSYYNARQSDAGNNDASYIRLKNLSFSWQLPQAALQKFHLNNLRLYTQGQNLLTITNYKGLDPENLSTNSLPMLRMITVGIQATF